MGLLTPLPTLNGRAFLFAVQLPAVPFGIGTARLVAMAHAVSSWLLALLLIVHLHDHHRRDSHHQPEGHTDELAPGGTLT